MRRDTPVRDRVHVVPLGFEYARLKEPIVQWNADVVVTLEYADNEREIPYLRDLVNELTENDRIGVDRRTCDIFDLYDALGAVSNAVADYSEEEVFVNLSGGSKITAIAGMIACMATGARPIYARPAYGPDASRIPAEPLHDEVRDIFELPHYPIDRPSDVHISFLAHIADETTETANGRYRGVSKKALIEFALQRSFPFVEASEATTQKGYYRLLDRHVLEPLSECIEVDKVGRTKYVTLSAEGTNVLRAFRHTVTTL